MKTLISQAEGYFEVKGSKFLSFLLPVSEFGHLRTALYAKHPKAVHFVSASRYINEHNQIIESFDDDREPKGSSGMPSLNVLRGEELINVAVIIVRYFGGQLLGVGGLVRAYTSATQNVIETAKIRGLLHTFSKHKSISLELAYNKISQCEYKAKQLGLSVYKDEFLADVVRLRIEGEESAIESFSQELLKAYGLIIH